MPTSLHGILMREISSGEGPEFSALNYRLVTFWWPGCICAKDKEYDQ